MEDNVNVQSGPRARWTWYIVGIMLAIASIDQVVKQLMLSMLTPGEPVPVIGDWFLSLIHI